MFAVGITGMQKLVTNCPALGRHADYRALMNLKTLDVMATRLWFDRPVSTRYPANVLSGFEPAAGGTFFNLNQLQAGLGTLRCGAAASLVSQRSLLQIYNMHIQAVLFH